MVRVRFAPSPTGPLHMGGVRTALYNYLFAKQNGGEFILRIEDTDSQRFVPGAEKYIIESLNWCGIKVDEGVGVGGPHAPYRQSERKEIYLKYAKQLVDDGWAYYAFDTPESLNSLRKDMEDKGETFAYNYQIREKLDTSLNPSMDLEILKERLEKENHWVIRFKMPSDRAIHMKDLVRGDVTAMSSTLDDKVLYKRIDSLPTYHLANIVDDHLMEITHVIRGEEWLPSLPLHYMLYEAFGWKDSMPEFAHLPLLLKPEGNGKLSKRDGDKLGFPVFPLRWIPEDGGDGARGYREDGYLPEAFVNMLALLGWNPGTEQEIMTMDEMIKLFSIEKVNKSGARFSPQKALWFNEQYLRSKSNSELAILLKPQMEANGVSDTDERIEKVCSLIKERATLVCDLWSLAKFYFVAPEEYDQKVYAKFYKNENPENLRIFADFIETIDDFTTENLNERCHAFIEEKQWKMGQIMNTTRLSVVGSNSGAAMWDIAEFLGKEETLKRMRAIK